MKVEGDKREVDKVTAKGAMAIDPVIIDLDEEDEDDGTASKAIEKQEEAKQEIKDEAKSEQTKDDKGDNKGDNNKDRKVEMDSSGGMKVERAVDDLTQVDMEIESAMEAVAALEKKGDSGDKKKPDSKR